MQRTHWPRCQRPGPRSRATGPASWPKPTSWKRASASLRATWKALKTPSAGCSLVAAACCQLWSPWLQATTTLASVRLRDLPEPGLTIRSDLELRLLRASTAIAQASPLAPQLIRESLTAAERYGFVQTVLETAPHVVDHLVAGSGSYPASPTLAALVAARLAERKNATAAPVRSALPDPLTKAEIRVLEKLSQRLTYVDIASDLNLSLNTIKTHLRHTYMKLGVASRSAAVKRATSLGVI